MSVLQAILYGVLQGLTEFLPVSSSGHLAILEHFFGFDSQAASFLSFEILLHLATLTAVFLVYYREILPLVPALLSLVKKAFSRSLRLRELTDHERMALYLILATLPMAAAALLKDRIAWLYADIRIVGLLLLINGFLLRFSEKSAGKKEIMQASPEDALTVGIFQMFAVLPGLSRSGTTITAGLSRGFSREFAVKFSFLLSIPAILGANLLELPALLTTPVPADHRAAMAIGMLAAFLTGIAAMKLLIWLSRRASFRFFSWYCWLAGGLTLLCSLLG